MTMDKKMELLNLLQEQQINFRERGDELITHCLFNDCDIDSRGNEAHLYINKSEGIYLCHKCGAKGNLWDLKKHFGVDIKKPQPKQPLNKIAEKYHNALPENIREYLLKDRLILNEEIEDRLIGYKTDSGGIGWITIPVFNISGDIIAIRLRIDPFINSNSPKYRWETKGSEATLYNAQVLKDKPDTLVICEGEFDCMLLASQGITAICSTAGASTFKDEWVEQLAFVREFYIVFDNDEAGIEGAKSLAEKIHGVHPSASVLNVNLPDRVGEHGDITDYFKNDLGTIEDLFEPTGKYVELVAGEKPVNVSDFSEISLENVADILSLTIKQDNESKLITFLCCLSAYTQEDQLNVSFNAPSSSGKTHITKEVASLFPESDKIELSGASPTSFYHGEGVYDKERGAKIVPLSRKILIFYEQPDPQLQEKLRSVLSHDSWEIKHRITNKNKKGAHRTELIIIEGFPATIFCSANLRLDEQETTRAILLSPEVNETKLKDGVHLQAKRGANPSEFYEWLNSQSERNNLKDRILAIKRESIKEVIIDTLDRIAIETQFQEAVGSIKPRHMRDMAHLLKLIKAIALLNVWFRRQPNGQIVASRSDIDQAFKLWQYFIDSQNLNISPIVKSFYVNYILPAYDEKQTDLGFGSIGVSRKEVLLYYLKKTNTPFSDDYLRKQILPQLESSGIITQEKPSEGDKRSMHIFPQWIPKQNNIGLAGGDLANDDVIEDPFDH